MFLAQIREQYGTMSKSQRKIAHFVETRYDEVAFEAVASIAGKIGTSSATVVRFCHALGYAGYSALQKEIQAFLLAGRDGTRAGTMAQEPAFDLPQMEAVARLMMTAERVFIVGFNESFGTAAELLHALDMVREKVVFTRLHVGDWNEIVEQLSPRTVMVVVSFTPQYYYTHRWFQRAQNAGCPTVVFTNAPLSPYNGQANHLVRFDLACRQDAYLYDLTPVSAYLYRMMSYIYENYPTKGRKRGPQYYLDEPLGIFGSREEKP